MSEPTLASLREAGAHQHDPARFHYLEVLERRHIEAVVANSETLEAAARTLGIDGSTLYRKRKAYGL